MFDHEVKVTLLFRAGADDDTLAPFVENVFEMGTIRDSFEAAIDAGDLERRYDGYIVDPDQTTRPAPALDPSPRHVEHAPVEGGDQDRFALLQAFIDGMPGGRLIGDSWQIDETGSVELVIDGPVRDWLDTGDDELLRDRSTGDAALRLLAAVWAAGFQRVDDDIDVFVHGLPLLVVELLEWYSDGEAGPYMGQAC